ncbi:hypothetical protein [Pleionea litopenaei]|uniref:Uncharacterized protein n=1 Tax=Pleionea litopenaei TaxID=3070815 RepID=A0AA51RWB3_9GAMM|nr:hypothetical protein [Pleionea sp. HL-JVS1]WMS88787.1 hypothetical protein Q9312_07675 [Pleionea sp. HL-JVS1]
MPSGKQVLLSVLQKYSQSRQSEDDLEVVSDRVKSALTLHCSTSGETMKKIQKLSWLSSSDESGLIKQGLGVTRGEAFLSDIFEELIEEDEIPKRIKKRFPRLTQEDYSDALDIIGFLLTSLQYWEELSSVEKCGHLDQEESEKLLKGGSMHLKSFSEEPW